MLYVPNTADLESVTYMSAVPVLLPFITASVVPEGYFARNKYTLVHKATGSTYSWGHGVSRDVCGQVAYEEVSYSLTIMGYSPGCKPVLIANVVGKTKVPYGTVWTTTTSDPLGSANIYTTYGALISANP